MTATAGACNTVPTSLRAQRQDGLQPDLNAVSLGTPFVPCGGGPHVTNTGDIGEGGKRFRIKKEEAVAAGVRRIKGVVE